MNGKNIKKIVRNPYLQDPNVFISNPFERNQVTLGKEKFVNYFKTQNPLIFQKFFIHLEYYEIEC